MPVGLNQAVPRFVKGHLYKIYYPSAPDQYLIVRFRRQGYKKVSQHFWDHTGTKDTYRTRSVKRQAYIFTPVVDNTATGRRVISYYLFTTIAKMNVEEIKREELPLFLDAKNIAPEFEKILKGRPSYIRRKKGPKSSRIRLV